MGHFPTDGGELGFEGGDFPLHGVEVDLGFLLEGGRNFHRPQDAGKLGGQPRRRQGGPGARVVTIWVKEGECRPVIWALLKSKAIRRLPCLQAAPILLRRGKSWRHQANL